MRQIDSSELIFAVPEKPERISGHETGCASVRFESGTVLM
jgi:hypothetical protein